MSGAKAGLAPRIVRWQAAHGRNSLPWQNTRDPYRVWLSEVMLQQTQVATVLDYYGRFVARFPDVKALAAAELDDVFALWSGLGYYSRARNLHRCAREVVALHGGEFPPNSRALQELPGVGRSTAAAIASLCFGERIAILDGNVKRVLTRVLGFAGDLSVTSQERLLWQEAQTLVETLPAASVPRYTQGLMDMGATVCLPRNPHCVACPVRGSCVAHKEGAPEAYPVKTRKLKRTAQSLWLLRAQGLDGSVWLEKRPATGIWGGLHCLPMFESRDALRKFVPERARGGLHDAAPFVHVLTHKDLHLHPVLAQLSTGALRARQGAWFASRDWPELGLPAPIRRLLEASLQA
jgi:A/G-specific adenine glycosylase